MVHDPNAEEEDMLFGAFPIQWRNVEQVQGYLLPLIDMANHTHNTNVVLKKSVNLLLLCPALCEEQQKDQLQFYLYAELDSLPLNPASGLPV